MQSARNSFWSTTGEYISSKDDLKETDPTCWNYTFQPDANGYGNHNPNSQRLQHGEAYWQNSCTKKIYQPTGSFPKFPKCTTSPCLYFPNTLIYAPRSANFL